MNMIKNSRGFNLVELLIGMSIGLFLLAGLLTFFGQNRQAYSYQQSQSGQQGSERLANIMFTNVLQQAGFSEMTNQRILNRVSLFPAVGPFADGQTVFGTEASATVALIGGGMSQPKVGQGSVYEIAAHDANGDYLDGGKNYSVTLPGPVPINNFWSFMVYSGQHRSMLETDQKFGGLDSNNPSVKANKDGSYTMWFGPKAPKGHEGNWIQTMPGKSYNVILRLYGPLQPWFDKTWKPGDFELVQ